MATKEKTKQFKMEVGFSYGAMGEKLEVQAKSQGLTLGKDAGRLEKIKTAILTLRFSDLIPDGQYDKLLQKFHRKVVAACKFLDPKKCINCKAVPEVVMDEDDKENSYVISHNEDICPFRYTTHQATRGAAIADWNKWITEQTGSKK